MHITFAALSKPEKGTVVVTVTDRLKLGKQAAELDKRLNNAITRAIKFQEFKGKKGETISLLAASEAYDMVLIVGLGEEKDFSSDVFRSIGGKISAALDQTKVKQATVLLDQLDKMPEYCADIAEGMELRSYRFDKYLTKQKDKGKLVFVNCIVACKDYKEASTYYKQQQPVIAGVKLARDLVTEPSNILFPKAYAKIIKAELEPLGCKVTVLGEKQMQAEGMGALLGVGQGSVQESQMVIVEWKGDKASKKAPLGFVGKGVTFDTGGISIKPAANMWDMKYDMGGSAVVIGLMKALAINKTKVNAVGVVGLVENMPDGNAQRPGDVVTSMSGQTIEVLNTDAEGRLVLADALTYIQKYYKPQLIVDLATLTGAIVISLGVEYAGLFSNDDDLSAKLLSASRQTSEKIWRFPLDEAYDKMIDSVIADMKNISLDKGAGSITAAQFLKRFIENDTPWAHLDIAGMAWEDRGRDLCAKGATGFGVRLLYRFIKERIKS